MNQLPRTTPNWENINVNIFGKNVSLIDITDDVISFVFKDGFDVTYDGTTYSTSKAKIEFSNCTANDFICYIIEEKTYRNNFSRYVVRKESITRLRNTLSFGHNLVILDEMYNATSIQWRGKLSFKNGNIYSIVIEISNCFPIRYHWE